MAGNLVSAAAPQALGNLGATATSQAETPVLRIRMDGGGTPTEIAIAIPRALSLRVARYHVGEQVAKTIKGQALVNALKDMGFK